ncbi:MAG TPA: hypothetical protein V6D08_03000 [Candidatus Obscuribacterales bacterium]
MYHPVTHKACELAKRGVMLLAACAVLAPAQAQPEKLAAVQAAQGSGPNGYIEWTANEYPILRRKDRFKKKPFKAQIFQIDREALGDRRPLLMVHGLRGEYWRDFRWGKVIKRFITYPDFGSKYKVYLLRYSSIDPLKSVLPQFKAAVLDLQRQSGGKPVTLLTLSMGGNLAHEALKDPDLDRAVRLVFTLGTPFHGSPLFCKDWFMYSAYKNLSFPWTRIDHSMAYRLYFKRNPNLLTDLAWDNCDGYIPDAGQFKSILPLGPSGNLTPETNANRRLLELNKGGGIDKRKFISYAAYLVNPYLKPDFVRYLESTLLYPYSLLTVKLPAHLAREHPVLKMLNRSIARTIPEAAAAANASGRFVYALNDGITPVNSALFVTAEACQECTTASESDLSRLKPYLEVRLARVFRNADHLTFIDGYRPRGASHMLRDELNPGDGLRTMFDWILSDIMQSDTLPGQLAKDEKPATDLEVK